RRRRPRDARAPARGSAACGVAGRGSRAPRAGDRCRLGARSTRPARSCRRRGPAPRGSWQACCRARCARRPCVRRVVGGSVRTRPSQDNDGRDDGRSRPVPLRTSPPGATRGSPRRRLPLRSPPRPRRSLGRQLAGARPEAPPRPIHSARNGNGSAAIAATARGDLQRMAARGPVAHPRTSGAAGERRSTPGRARVGAALQLPAGQPLHGRGEGPGPGIRAHRPARRGDARARPAVSGATDRAAAPAGAAAGEGQPQALDWAAGRLYARAHRPQPSLRRDRGALRWQEFWEPVHPEQGARIVLEPEAFYLLLSAEGVSVPPCYAAEMLAYDPTAGELRTHYAGFFDPGFGYSRERDARGARAALEVRARDVSFMVEHRQPVCKLAFERMAGEPDVLYGEELGSSYQHQQTMLSKIFLEHAAGVA